MNKEKIINQCLSMIDGLDGIKVTTESSLTRRLREAIDE